MSNRLLITCLCLSGLLVTGAVSAQDSALQAPGLPNQTQESPSQEPDQADEVANVLADGNDQTQPDDSIPINNVLPTAAVPLPPAARLTPAERSFANTEADLLRKIRLLDLQIEVDERQRKLFAPPENASVAPATNVSPVAMAPVASPASAPAPARTAQPIRLSSVWGTEGMLKAEFTTTIGKRVVTIGEHIYDGWVLESLHQGVAIVRKGNRTDTLKMGI